MFLRNLFESAIKTAVLGWGRGMGHKGHMLLAQAVLHHAQENGAKPFFVVSRTSLVDPATGQAWADKPTFTKTKDDPLSPEEKLATYRKVFPQNAEVFSVATPDASTLDKVLAKIAGEGFSKVILIVGEQEKASFSFLTRPDKSGVPPYQRAGLQSLEIISRQDTTEPSSVKGSPSYQEGPRATPMRQVLSDPTKSEEEQFAVWRRDMPDNLSDEEVKDLMLKAKARMMAVPAAKNKKQGVAEFAMSGDDEEDPTDNYPCYDCGSTIFLHHTELCELAEDNAIRDLPSKPGSQHWTGEIPKGLHPIPRLAEATFKKSPYGRTAASQQRARELLNPPKPPEPKKDEKTDEEKQRLDPSCWKGYRKQGTKMKGDTRVNNCVKVSEGVENIMDALINKIIVNEAIQNNRK